MAIIRPMAKRKRSEHYVNNKEFLAALIKYQEDIEIARLQDKPKPVIPRYIGECFLKIANHLSFKPNFVNYMFKEDMISDGIENCVQYIHNFNPEKSKNPFAYFTQIIHSPVTFSEIKNKGGLVGYKVEPWLKTTREDMFIVNMDNVITLSESDDMEMIVMYQHFLRDSQREMQHQHKLNRRMGYLSNVNDAKENLEKIFKLDSPENKSS